MALTPIFLRSEVGPMSEAHTDDVVIVKRGLQRTGYYQTPFWALSGGTEHGFFDAIRSFQSGQGLHVDGRMEPNGPTAYELGFVLDSVPILRDLFRKRKNACPAENECDDLYFNHDRPICNEISETWGKRAAERCWTSANRRYSECLRGKPIHLLPPLDTRPDP